MGIRKMEEKLVGVARKKQEGLGWVGPVLMWANTRMKDKRGKYAV